MTYGQSLATNHPFLFFLAQRNGSLPASLMLMVLLEAGGSQVWQKLLWMARKTTPACSPIAEIASGLGLAGLGVWINLYSPIEIEKFLKALPPWFVMAGLAPTGCAQIFGVLVDTHWVRLVAGFASVFFYGTMAAVLCFNAFHSPLLPTTTALLFCSSMSWVSLVHHGRRS